MSYKKEKGLSGNNSTPQTKSVSLHETQLTTYLKDLHEQKCKVEVKFDSYECISYTIESLIKVSQFAMEFKEEQNLSDNEMSASDIRFCFELLRQLIPHSNLELLSKIKEEFNQLKNQTK